jgi:hypothetical protein
MQDIVSQAVTTAVRDVREELGTRIQSLEQIVDKQNTESRVHVSKTAIKIVRYPIEC